MKNWLPNEMENAYRKVYKPLFHVIDTILRCKVNNFNRAMKYV